VTQTAGPNSREYLDVKSAFGARLQELEKVMIMRLKDGRNRSGHKCGSAKSNPEPQNHTKESSYNYSVVPSLSKEKLGRSNEPEETSPLKAPKTQLCE
jgi:hypothetical protein